MSSVGVVLDACVLYPAALRDTLLRAAAAGLYRLHWSGDILAEARRNLVTNHAVTEEQAERLFAAMRAAFPDAAVTGYERVVPAMPTHEKDRHVAAAAVVARAQAIVTSNLKDFPSSALEPFGVEPLSPDEFLLDLVESAPRVMVDVLRDQAAGLRNPPMTVEEILADVALQAPRFAQRMTHLLRL